MNLAYLILGSNLGNRETYLSEAIKLISERAGKILNSSSIYNTAAWPPQSGQSDFLNQAIQIETELSADELLQTILDIELILGRKRAMKWDARTIDIDILFYNQEVIQAPNLTIPHAFLHERKFVLAPLAEIAKDLVHPVFKKTIGELLSGTSDKLDTSIHTEVRF